MGMVVRYDAFGSTVERCDGHGCTVRWVESYSAISTVVRYDG